MTNEIGEGTVINIKSESKTSDSGRLLPEKQLEEERAKPAAPSLLPENTVNEMRAALEGGLSINIGGIWIRPHSLKVGGYPLAANDLNGGALCS